MVRVCVQILSSAIATTSSATSSSTWSLAEVW